MALVHGDGFDHYGVVANMAGIYTTANGVLDTTAPKVRTGAYSYRVDSLQELAYTLSAPTTELYVGIAFYRTGVPADNQRERLWEFIGVGGAPGDYSCVLTFNPDRGFSIWEGFYGARSDSPTNVWNLNEWNYVEVHIKTGAPSIFEVRVNGVVIWTLAATRVLAKTIAQLHMLNYLGSQWWNDDLYIVDTAAGQNTYCGEVRCRTLMATADGALQNWVPNAGVTGYAQIDEVPPNDAVDYITADGAGDISSFEFANILPNTNACYGLVGYSRAIKSDAGAASARINFVNQYGTLNGAAFNPATGYSYRQSLFPLGPGGFFWDKDTVNNCQFQIERIS